MKRILFISTRSPYSGRYSGDVLRSQKIINLLEKNYNLDICCLSKEKVNIKKTNLTVFNYPNFFLKILFCLISFIRFRPIHFGLFYSNEMNLFVQNNANNYDYLFFYHIRSSQYLPKNFYGKTIIEMGDLYSENYFQTYNYLKIYNPLKYIYFLESLLTIKLEKKIFDIFDKIILFSKNDVRKISNKFKNKIFQIDESVEKIIKKFSFSKKSSKILFIGNINYLPNFLACRDFIKNIFPKLKLQYPQIKFLVIGEINEINKKLLSIDQSVEILGPKNNLSSYIKNSICGLANLKIASGVQGKVLTYMSFGLPVICSQRVAQNFGSNVLTYKNETDLIKIIISLKNNKSKSIVYSKKSLKFSKNLNWRNVSKKYLKLF